MADRERWNRIARWVLAALILAAGLSAALAWGRVPREAQPASSAVEEAPSDTMLYAAWQPVAGARTVLYRSADRGETWQPVPVRTGIASVIVWASDGADRVAVALSDGSLLRSGNQGERWSSVGSTLPVLSLAFGVDGQLFIGTDGLGVWRQVERDDPAPLASAGTDLSGASVRFLALAGGRLFAATSGALFRSDDEGLTFTAARAVPGRISALAALDSQTVYLGTEGTGILKSGDAGLSWQPVEEGLGLAAGVTLRITALRSDPSEPGVLYAGVSYLVGGTQLHESPAGAFVTLDGGASWLRLAGPAFPEAQRAGDLVPVPSRPLTVLAATPEGLQAYEPNVAAALSLLGSGTAAERANAARLLGLARARGTGEALLAALADPENAVAQAAADALGRLDDPASVPALQAALAGSDAQVKRNAARALGQLRAESSVVPLGALLMQGEPATAGAAAEALRQIGSLGAVDALLAPLADRQVTVRRHAALAALEALGEPAVEPLVSRLGGQDVGARRNAAEALGWIGSASATDALIDALRDEQEGVRSEAAWALGEIADPGAQRALARARSSDPSVSVRDAAAFALTQLAARPAAQAAGWAAVRAALRNSGAARWLLLGLSIAAAGLLAARNLRPSAVHATRRDHRHYR